MKLAIMQPYFLPYLGYFQLIASVDKFVVYDDVSYIKNGWINRNNLLVQGRANLITIPLQNGRSGVPIREVLIAGKREFWMKKILRTVSESYAKAPFYAQVFPMFENWMKADIATISELNVTIIRDICAYLELRVEISPTSTIYANSELRSVERVLDICEREGADNYINALGGRELYSQDKFRERGITLNFLKPVLDSYPQGKNEFVAGLSILDVLMWNCREAISTMLSEYSLVD
jgi:hypothetical protein